MAGIIIVNADSANFKVINRLLLAVRVGDPEDEHSFKVMRSTDDLSVDLKDVTEPPLRSFENNSFESLTIRQIESTMIKLDPERKGNTSLFLLLDEQGVRDQTVIVAKRIFGDGGYTDEYDKARVPWKSVYLMWCNLEVANMGFDDFVDDYEPDGSKGRWFAFRATADDDKDDVEEMEEEIKKLEKDGLA